MIQDGEDGWEKLVPKKLADLIKEKSLFTSQPKVEELV
jgi:hypothetical protein